MSVYFAKLPGAVLCSHEVSSAAKLTYAVLDWHAAPGEVARITTAQIMAVLGWGRRKHVATGLSELEEAGFILNETPPGAQINTYRLPFRRRNTETVAELSAPIVVGATDAR